MGTRANLVCLFYRVTVIANGLFNLHINCELGIDVRAPTKGKSLRALYGFLLAQYEKGLTAILVIDEAHQIPRNVLEEIRLLTNFETAQQKLVQIILVGQPELNDTLDSVELRPLKQRVAVRCELEPLRANEIRNYIERRLALAGAGAEATEIFPQESLDAIALYSQGIPRLINNICDQAMTAAYTAQTHTVSVGIVDEVASRLRLESVDDLKKTAAAFPLVEQADNSSGDIFSEHERCEGGRIAKPCDLTNPKIFSTFRPAPAPSGR